ncbi:MAG TPA: phosphoribosylaminoimidazolesuccinocarboxamide synthase [Acidobacteriota bacterium]|nr:phosphoribosylaminoimidazolesuccinocarboxamide synthase [Acidobacteriota bacterium]
MAKTTYICQQTELSGMKLLGRGKVRDLYEYRDKLLLVATDRISAFDVVLPTMIPCKGAVLTQLSRFWFEMTQDIVPNHLLSADVGAFPEDLQQFRDVLDLRSMLTVRAEMFPIECVVRGFLAGSGWHEYKKSGTIGGIKIPGGLKESDQLPEPIFTPATKASTGHDTTISFDEAAGIIGGEYAEQLRDYSFMIYRRASEYAIHRGIIIADVKFEFGVFDGKIILCDELLTPDSSRFWPRSDYRPGMSQPSFDKQFVRDYLEQIHFDKKPPAPQLPDHVVQGTMEKYLEAYRLLTGRVLI